MIPHNNKLIASYLAMKKTQTIAKSPTGEPSIQKPTWVDAKIDKGNIKDNEVAYQITAINEYGETAASVEYKATLGESLNCVENIVMNTISGILPKGVYYYGVTAYSASGETNIITPTPFKLAGTQPPAWADSPNQVTPTGGLIPVGTYYYSITTVVGENESNQSTPLEVLVNTENSVVSISFKSVDGASKYNIYRRSVAVGGALAENVHPRRIGQILANDVQGSDQTISFTDTGAVIGQEVPPTINNTTAGIQITWDKLKSNSVLGYRVYGRTSPNSQELQLLYDTQSPNINTFKDDGYKPLLQKRPPATNESGYNKGASIELRWNKVGNATGYRIYGRGIQTPDGNTHKGFMVTISDPNVTSWLDTGIVTPDITSLPPVTDTTDGTKGILGSVVPDGATLEINAEGLLSVKGGIDSFLGRSQILNPQDKDVLIYDKKIANWVNIDLQKLIFDLISLKAGSGGSIITGVDPQFEQYKNDLINSLNTIQSFKTEFAALETKVAEQAKEIESLKAIIGKSFNTPIAATMSLETKKSKPKKKKAE